MPDQPEGGRGEQVVAARRESLERLRHRRHDRGDGDPGDLPGERQPLLFQEPAEQEGQLVRRPLRVRADAAAEREVAIPEHPELGLGVAYVHREQHLNPILKGSAGGRCR